MTLSRPGMVLGVAAAIAFLVTGCTGQATYKPLNPDSALFWHNQTSLGADLLEELVQEFNAGRIGTKVLAEYSGNYGQIHQKVMATIQAGSLPAQSVAYPNMIAAYAEAGAAVSLSRYVKDANLGLGQDTLDDFFPAVLDMNRYESLGGEMYSFPFAKSVLVMYFNTDVLDEAGIESPPDTWQAFLDQCRKIKAATGKHACAIEPDPSTVHGMIFSMGGNVVSGKETQYDSPEALAVFELFESLVNEGLVYQIPIGSYDDQLAFGQDRVAFIFRPSSTQPYVKMAKEGNEGWGIARLPQKDPANAATVLYGPNLCVFRTNEAQQAAAWEFAKFFTSMDVSVRWALATGYVPIRKSAANHPDMQAYWNEWQYNKVAFDCLPIAKAEPALSGWNEVRDLVVKAQTGVLSGATDAKAAAKTLKQQADQVFLRY